MGKEKEIITQEELLRRLRSPTEKREAFSDVVCLYGRRIYWQLRAMVHSHDDADDLLQETFLRAWIAIDSFRGEARISTWLYRIASYEALSFLRKRKLRREQNLEAGDDNSSLSDRLEADPYFDADRAESSFQEALASLPEKQRLVFTLRYYNDLPYAEIAQITGTSEGALKASYHHAVKKLEHFLVPED